jgi:hypothetical protein
MFVMLSLVLSRPTWTLTVMMMKRRFGVLFLATTLPLALLSWPFLVLCAFIPIVGFLSLPTTLACSIYLIYGSTWLAYLTLAPTTPLPYSPFRAYKVVRALLRWVKEAWTLNLGSISMDWSYRRVLVLGSKGRDKIIRENIAYGSVKGNKKLDVYLPMKRSSNDPAQENDISNEKKAPIIVFIPGGAWSLVDKRYYLQVALTLRKKGMLVVIPDIVSSSSSLLCVVG